MRDERVEGECVWSCPLTLVPLSHVFAISSLVNLRGRRRFQVIPRNLGSHVWILRSGLVIELIKSS